jgi:hypothetical protein
MVCAAWAFGPIQQGAAQPTNPLGVPPPSPPPQDAPVIWEETTTEHFVILTQPSTAAERDYLVARADGLYDALASLFGIALETPITLQLFSSAEAFRAANPLTVEIDGVLDPGRRGRREIDIAVPRAVDQPVADGVPGAGGVPAAAGVGVDGGPRLDDASQLRLDNALRRELAYRFAARLSDDRLSAGFRAGIAQYLEQPGEQQAAGVARVRDALEAGRLYNWADLNAPGAAFTDPPLTGPQNLSIVHYLAATHGFPRLVRFIEASASASGWRDAFETAYDQPPVDLEAAWRTLLPAYLDGGWREHVLYGQGSGLAEAMLAQGDYAGARAHLAGVLALAAADPAAAEPLRALLARAESGLAAREQLEVAGAALSAGNYGEALAAATAAGEPLDTLGDRAGFTQAVAMAGRAREGVDAAAALARSERLPPWRLIEARHAAYQAAIGFGRVGNDVAAARAGGRVEAIDRRLAPAGWAFLVLGTGLLIWNLRLRLKTRDGSPRDLVARSGTPGATPRGPGAHGPHASRTASGGW